MIDNPMSRGRLKNGNSPGDLSKAPRCGAKTRSGALCRQPGMKNGRRCRLHGGKSLGAPQGERNGNYRHGLRTMEAAAAKREALKARRLLRALISEAELLSAGH
jgi:glucans biosynthesis protein